MDPFITFIILMLFLIILSRFIVYYMKKRYFVKLFKPVKLNKKEIGTFEAKSRIAIEWVPDNFIYSLPSALKMAHDYFYEEKMNIHEINFYLGWTYTWVKSGPIEKGIFFPLRDPLEFLPRVGINMGLSINMYTSRDYKTLIKGMKKFISEGKPILAVVDSRYFKRDVSDDESLIGFRQYFILVVGYDEKGKFLYLDTIKTSDKEETVEKEIDSNDLILAISSYLKLIRFPFKYCFWVLDRGPKEMDLNENLNFISELLIGGSYKSNFQLGSMALEVLATEIEEKGIPNKMIFNKIFQFAQRIKRDNAVFLNEFLSKTGSEKVLKLAQILERASNLYLRISQGENVEEIVNMLKRAAELERETGELIKS